MKSSRARVPAGKAQPSSSLATVQVPLPLVSVLADAKTAFFGLCFDRRAASVPRDDEHDREQIERVHHPSLPTHPEHDIAKRQMAGCGGVESPIEQPAVMIFYELSTEEWLQVGITDSLVRYAVGIEDADDLIADRRQALEQI